MTTTKKQKNSSQKSSTKTSSPKTSTPRKTTKKWSSNVTKHSNALDLDKGIFKSKSPNKIAHSLEDSAEKSTRKKGSSYQSAMSMLNFYINRAGKNLPAKQKAILVEAKEKLQALHNEHK
ncbi:MAG: DUF3175 domain-containing protein [Bacteroidetes bacterium]|nr:DUF3175 domain-containing protein [Bacteroidota bacterium]